MNDHALIPKKLLLNPYGLWQGHDHEYRLYSRHVRRSLCPLVRMNWTRVQNRSHPWAHEAAHIFR